MNIIFFFLKFLFIVVQFFWKWTCSKFKKKMQFFQMNVGVVNVFGMNKWHVIIFFVHFSFEHSYECTYCSFCSFEYSYEQMYVHSKQCTINCFFWIQTTFSFFVHFHFILNSYFIHFWNEYTFVHLNIQMNKNFDLNLFKSVQIFWLQLPKNPVFKYILCRVKINFFSPFFCNFWTFFVLEFLTY